MYVINGSAFIVFGMLCYLVSRTTLIGIRIKRKRQLNRLKEMILSLFALYSCMVVSVTLFPFPIGFGSNEEIGYHSVNLIPLKTIIYNINQIGTAYDWDVTFMIGLIARNVGGNILLLMPLGFLAPLIWNTFKSFKNVVLLGLISTVSIECLQYVQSMLFGGWGRVTDIDDVICNLLGTVIGFILFKLFIGVVGKFYPSLLQRSA